MTIAVRFHSYVRRFPAVVGVATLLLGTCLSQETPTSNLGTLTVDDVLKAQDSWGRGLVGMVNGSLDINEFVDNIYAFGETGKVLFKPTLAVDYPIRTTKQCLMAYFVGGECGSQTSEEGFLRFNWTNVEWIEPREVLILPGNTSAVAMGKYNFVAEDPENSASGVHYTYVYTSMDTLDGEDDAPKARVAAHHSSLPVSFSE